MTAAVVAALVACLAFAAAGPHLARALPPAVAVRLLVPGTLLSAGAGVFVLGTLTFTGLGQLADVARFGTWSPQRLHALSPIPPAVSVIAGTVLAPAALWATQHAVRTIWALWRVHCDFRHLNNPDGSPIVIVDSPDPDAFTLPGLSARIVVTTGILSALDPDGRRIVLAHEESHRHHRHTWWTMAADLAAAINPLLRRTAREVRLATERWADEDAASTADRRRVATTIAQMALLRTRQHTPTSTAAAAGGDVPQRVRSLLRPPTRARRRHITVFAALILAILFGVLAVERTGESLFEQAERPAVSGHVTTPPGW